MVRVTIFAFVLLWTGSPAYSQLFDSARDRGEPIFTPLKNLRDRAEAGGVLAEKAKAACDASKLKGKLRPEAACKRCQAQKKEEAEKANDAKAEKTEMKKLEAEAKKAELEAKKLEEDDKKRNKPWDIADEENLEQGDLLMLAAQAKKDQDLAPKKQQALDYLASLGCNKDPRVTKAIMAGLQDHNADVRMTAVQSVIYAVRGPAGLEYPVDPYINDPYVVYGQESFGCGCESQNLSRRAKRLKKQCSPQAPPEDSDCPVCDIAKRKKEAKQDRKKQREDRKMACRCGRVDGSCNCGLNGYPVAYSVPGESCQACESCQSCENGCKSCCDEKIREELRKMAFDPDPDRPNCFYEPSLDVRNLALEAFNLCPEKAEEEPEPVVDQGTSETDGAEEEEEGVSEGDGFPEGDPDLEEVDGLEEEATDDEPAEDDSQAFNLSSHVVKPGTKMLRGRVKKFMTNGYEIQHSTQYHIPAGNRLYIATGGDDAHVVEVVSSNAGSATVKVVDGRFAAKTSSVSIGVMR